MGKKLSERGSPRGLLRWLVRLPIWLYRLRLGFLMGARFILLEHRGRSSGARRFTVLEVVHSDAQGLCIASGWGDRAQWYRNVMKSPEVAVTQGLRRYRTRIEGLQVEEATGLLAGYASRNPGAFKALARFMLGEKVQPDAGGAARLARHVPLMRLPPPR